MGVALAAMIMVYEFLPSSPIETILILIIVQILILPPPPGPRRGGASRSPSSLFSS